MKINVNSRVEIREGQEFKTLFSKANPHDVSDVVGKALVKEGKATICMESKTSQQKTVEKGTELNSLTVKELRDLAFGLGVDGFAEMNKEKLVQAIDAAEKKAAEKTPPEKEEG